MKIEFVSNFPYLMLDENGNIAWDTVVDSEHHNTALLITTDSLSNDPAALVSMVGSKQALAAAINQIVFNDEELAIALLNEMSKDPNAIRDIITLNSSN